MQQKIICQIPINRSEGDLHLRVAVEGDEVCDVWSASTMFRGIEQLLLGRGALDGLVMTPRICGICSTTHLLAAAQALDAIAQVPPPPNAIRHRNVALMAETIQSDIRQSLLMFLVDFTNEAYKEHPLYPEAVARYTPLRGDRCRAAIRQTKRLVEVIALLGGQWPHSSFMVPGGVVYRPSLTELLECYQLVTTFQRWYEEQILGCSVQRWLEISSSRQLEAWLEESPDHQQSDTGFLLRFGRQAGLHQLGQGPQNFLCYGSLPLPPDSEVSAPDGAPQLIPAAFARHLQQAPFSPDNIDEDTTHSWYADHPAPLHPSKGETEPLACGQEGEKYTWAKAPRYEGQPAETGPLAERIAAQDPLFGDLLQEQGANVLVRQLARLTRPTLFLKPLLQWLREMQLHHKEPFYVPAGELEEGEGAGLIQAARGALGHWVRLEKGQIAHYQIITPTAWNGSPRDANGTRGPWEEALLHTPVRDLENPVEVGHVLRSFDPCLVCNVHRIGQKKPWLTL